MNAARLTVVYPLDPLGPKVGGSVSFIQGLVRHAPEAFDLRFVGVTADPHARPTNRWTSVLIGDRPFQFLPLLAEIDEDRRRAIPLSLRFVARLARHGLDDDGAVLLHNRIETSLTPGVHRHRNAVVIHNDLHGQISSGRSEMLWSRIPRFYYAMEKRALRHVDQVYTVSGRTLEGLKQRYANLGERFSFLPTWVESDMFGPSATERTQLRAELTAFGVSLDPRMQWVLYAGRLQPQKAPERLLDAYACLRGLRPETALLIVGSGNLRDRVERRIDELGLRSHVCLVPPVPQRALVRFYQAADVLALTSDFEGMPMGVLEALACGLPVVTTRVGEVARVVINGTTGEIVETFEATDIAHALARVLANPSAYDTQACVAAVAQYTPRRVLAPIYERLLALHRLGLPVGRSAQRQP